MQPVTRPAACGSLIYPRWYAVPLPALGWKVRRRRDAAAAVRPSECGARTRLLDVAAVDFQVAVGRRGLHHDGEITAPQLRQGRRRRVGHGEGPAGEPLPEGDSAITRWTSA